MLRLSAARVFVLHERLLEYFSTTEPLDNALNARLHYLIKALHYEMRETEVRMFQAATGPFLSATESKRSQADSIEPILLVSKTARAVAKIMHAPVCIDWCPLTSDEVPTDDYTRDRLATVLPWIKARSEQVLDEKQPLMAGGMDAIEATVGTLCDDLMERSPIDAIQIVATCHDPSRGQTGIIWAGRGNHYARRAAVEEYLDNLNQGRFEDLYVDGQDDE